MQDESQVNDYMKSQPDIKVRMRSILVDWLIEVHRRFELKPETLYFTINILDRYLSMENVPRRELHLVGIGFILLPARIKKVTVHK
jgi:hypothetical protein